jgi:hypothetical protein
MRSRWEVNAPWNPKPKQGNHPTVMRNATIPQKEKLHGTETGPRNEEIKITTRFDGQCCQALRALVLFCFSLLLGETFCVSSSMSGSRQHFLTTQAMSEMSGTSKFWCHQCKYGYCCFAWSRVFGHYHPQARKPETHSWWRRKHAFHERQKVALMIESLAVGSLLLGMTMFKLRKRVILLGTPSCF